MSLKVYVVLNSTTDEVIGLFQNKEDADSRCEKQGNLYPQNAYEVDEWFVH